MQNAMRNKSNLGNLVKNLVGNLCKNHVKSATNTLKILKSEGWSYPSGSSLGSLSNAMACYGGAAKVLANDLRCFFQRRLEMNSVSEPTSPLSLSSLSFSSTSELNSIILFYSLLLFFLSFILTLYLSILWITLYSLLFSHSLSLCDSSTWPESLPPISSLIKRRRSSVRPEEKRWKGLGLRIRI